MSERIRKPVLIVIAGPNGSGKTSVTSKILHHEWMEDSVYINPDIVAQELFGDWNSVEAIKKAVIYCEEWRENRTYLYDNSVENADATILLRLSDGVIVKRYIEQLPEWAKQIIE